MLLLRGPRSAWPSRFAAVPRADARAAPRRPAGSRSLGISPEPSSRLRIGVLGPTVLRQATGGGERR